MAMKARYSVANGRVIAQKRAGVRSFFVHDPSGNTRALRDNSQTKTDTATYWPYGEIRTSSGATVFPFKFDGRDGVYTDSVNLAYARARNLEKRFARWLTVDPRWPTEPPYGYASMNPVSFIDPAGLSGELALGSKVLDWGLKGSRFGLVGAGIGVVAACLVYWITRQGEVSYSRPRPLNCGHLSKLYHAFCDNLPLGCNKDDSCVTLELKMWSYCTCFNYRRLYKLYCLRQKDWKDSYDKYTGQVREQCNKCKIYWAINECTSFVPPPSMGDDFPGAIKGPRGRERVF